MTLRSDALQMASWSVASTVTPTTAAELTLSTTEVALRLWDHIYYVDLTFLVAWAITITVLTVSCCMFYPCCCRRLLAAGRVLLLGTPCTASEANRLQARARQRRPPSQPPEPPPEPPPAPPPASTTTSTSSWQRDGKYPPPTHTELNPWRDVVREFDQEGTPPNTQPPPPKATGQPQPQPQPQPPPQPQTQPQPPPPQTVEERRPLWLFDNPPPKSPAPPKPKPATPKLPTPAPTPATPTLHHPIWVAPLFVPNWVVGSQMTPAIRQARDQLTQDMAQYRCPCGYQGVGSTVGTNTQVLRAKCPRCSRCMLLRRLHGA